jgi:glycosyltransferase involved in cell wall biosynthesis
MDAGLPSVVTPNTGSQVRDGVDGFIVPNADADALTDRLAVLAGDPARRAELGRNARERFAEFTSEKYVQRLAQVVRDGWATRRPTRCGEPSGVSRRV